MFVSKVASRCGLCCRTYSGLALSKSAAASNSLTDEQQTVGEDQQSTAEGPDVLVPADSFITWHRDGAVKLRLKDTGPAADRPISVMTYFKQIVDKIPNNAALATKDESGNWFRYTYQDYHDNVQRAARAFIRLGLEPHNAVGILGFNSPEWFISKLAAIHAGGMATGIYATNTPEACRYVVNHARCNILVVENERQLKKILQVRNKLPHLKTIVQYKGQPTVPGVLSWSELMDIGSPSVQQELDKRIKEQAPNKCCLLVYTSGTTGEPKAAMISHDNIVWTGKRATERAHMKFNDDHRLVSYLPLSHIAAQVTDIYVGMTSASVLYFAQPDALQGSLGQTLKEACPTGLLGVPRVWEKLEEAIVAVGKKNGPAKRYIAAWAKNIGSKAALARMAGNNKAPFMFGLARKLVLGKVRQALGFERIGVCISSAAPISRSTLDFFISLNIPLIEVYGLSETTGPHTFGSRYDNAVGSVGRELSGADTIVLNPNEEGIGELCPTGRNLCMGYLDNEEKTREAFSADAQYFHSGDLGRKDSRGYVYVTGRIKEILITAGGENIPNIAIEDKVKEKLPCVSQCMLIGDRRKYLILLLSLRTEQDNDTTQPLDALSADVIEWCRQHGVDDVTTLSGARHNPKVLQVLQEAIDTVNKQATSRAQLIRKWEIVPQDFSIAGGELGPTLKLRRFFVANKYRDLIESMYDSQLEGCDVSNKEYATV